MKTKGKTDHPFAYTGETIALFAALCIFLSTVEYMIPKPVPFLRLGLANLPIIIGVMVFLPKDVLLLVLLKAVGQGLINGTLFSYIFLFSLSGTIASGIVMLAVYYGFKSNVSLVGISVLGALASNFVQLLLSEIFIFGDAVKYIAPPFLVAGFVTSVILGIFASSFIQHSKWLKTVRIK